MRPSARRRFGVLFVLLSGCSTASAPPPEDASPAPTDPTVTTGPVGTERPAAPPAVSARASASPSSSLAPSPSGSASASAPEGGTCASDRECRWNDACFPSACVVGKLPPISCDESGPEPGTCRCRAGRCALVYHGTSGRCARDADCTWNDPCNPTVCSLGKPPAFVGCDKSRPAPGRCLCVDHACASVTP